jgi:hypothetical protein
VAHALRLVSKVPNAARVSKLLPVGLSIPVRIGGTPRTRPTTTFIVIEPIPKAVLVVRISTVGMSKGITIISPIAVVVGAGYDVSVRNIFQIVMVGCHVAHT